jgi:hypothetical protein
MNELRALGPEGLRRFLEQDQPLDDATLDTLCAQKDARHSLLYWFTDLDLAIAEAKRTNRPILSLHLLGRLDEELSCANSRFFRTTLYPHPKVSAELREHFVLHWHSVRPVPVVRVDFGNGRTLTRTITGNSAHLVLDSRGRPVDVIPGMHAPHAFLDALRFARTLAAQVSSLPDAMRTAALAHGHERRHTTLLETWARAVKLPRERNAQVLEQATTDWKKLAGPIELNSAPRLLDRKVPTAREAGARAMTKLRVELPVLNALSSLENVVAEDTARNRFILHRHVHEHFMTGAPTDDWRELSDWVSETLFLMPPNDPWLGLAPDDAFSGIERGGLT